MRGHGAEIVANPSVPHCIVICALLQPPAGSTLLSTTTTTTTMTTTAPSLLKAKKNKRSVQINNLIEQGEKDIIDFHYFLHCIVYQTRLPCSLSYYIATSLETRNSYLRLSYNIDLYNDSYHQYLTMEECQLYITHQLPDIIELAQQQQQKKTMNVKKSANLRKRMGMSQETEQAHVLERLELAQEIIENYQEIATLK